jgi:hypothetical protein
MNPKAPLPALHDQKPSWKAAAVLARRDARGRYDRHASARDPLARAGEPGLG